jgi:Copper amine oxidase N-terminal domain
MKRLAAALALAAALPFAATPALAADRIVKLTLDGRPVDRTGDVALLHGGVIYADVVKLVKSFDGLLTFQGPAVVVSIGGTNATFTAGSRTAKIGDGAVTMRGAAFLRNGDLYVPLDTFITRVAGAKLRVDPGQTHADIAVNSPSS